jgi:hypothetical protein
VLARKDRERTCVQRSANTVCTCTSTAILEPSSHSHVGSALPKLAVIADMRHVDPMNSLPMQRAEVPACAGVHDCKVIELYKAPQAST